MQIEGREKGGDHSRCFGLRQLHTVEGYTLFISDVLHPLYSYVKIHTIPASDIYQNVGCTKG